MIYYNTTNTTTKVPSSWESTPQSLNHFSNIPNTYDALDALANSLAFASCNNTKITNHLPKVTDVKFAGTATIMQFADGTSTKAVCSKGDEFSKEVGITVCYLKKILGGSGSYTKFIKNCLQFELERIKKAEAEAKEKARIANKREKNAKRNAKRKAEKIKIAIEIQKEAYKKAIEELSEQKTKEKN